MTDLPAILLVEQDRSAVDGRATAGEAPLRELCEIVLSNLGYPVSAAVMAQHLLIVRPELKVRIE